MTIVIPRNISMSVEKSIAFSRATDNQENIDVVRFYKENTKYLKNKVKHKVH